MSEDGKPILIGAWEPTLPNSQPFACEDCGKRVWLSPASIKLREERQLRVVCWDCGCEGGMDVQPPTEEQLLEILAWKNRN